MANAIAYKLNAWYVPKTAENLQRVVNSLAMAMSYGVAASEDCER